MNYMIYDKMIQLMQALFSTIDTAQQPKWQDKSTRPAVDVVKLENQSASPMRRSVESSKTKNGSKIPLDIAGDIKRLEQAFFDGHKLQSGFVVETTLQDLLLVCPRKRRRKDAYKSLSQALGNMGVELIIKSQKDGKKTT